METLVERGCGLDVHQATVVACLTKREKRTCRCCKGARIVAAPLPVRIIEKGLVSDGVVIDTLIRKYCDHRLGERNRDLTSTEGQFLESLTDWASQVPRGSPTKD